MSITRLSNDLALSTTLLSFDFAVSTMPPSLDCTVSGTLLSFDLVVLTTPLSLTFRCHDSAVPFGDMKRKISQLIRCLLRKYLGCETEAYREIFNGKNPELENLVRLSL
jgi:hypothetical protein